MFIDLGFSLVRPNTKRSAKIKHITKHQKKCILQKENEWREYEIMKTWLFTNGGRRYIFDQKFYLPPHGSPVSLILHR